MAKSIEAQMREIQARIEAKVDDIMMGQVADAVVEEAKVQVQEVVYDAYMPVESYKGGYERTQKLRDDWDVSKVSNGVKIRSDRYEDGQSGKPKYIPEVIITGKGYDITGKYDYETPRDFIGATKKSLKKDKTFEKIMRKELGKHVKIK